MQHKKLIISFLSFIATSAALIITQVKSQNASPSPAGISVSPPTFEITGNPGDTITNVIRVENMGTSNLKLAVDRRNFTAIGEDGAVGLTEEENGFSLSSWLSVEPTSTSINAKSTKNFKYTIKVPLNAEPGGHFGSIIFRTIPEEKLEGSGASLAQEVGSLILLKIAGSTQEEAKIDSFKPAKDFFEYGPVTLEARVSNMGNVHVRPRGTITISNLFGQKVATLSLDSKNVLPGAIRKLDTVWDTKWRLGRYTATLVMVYGADQTQRASITNFVVLPYKIVIIVVVILLIVLKVLHKSRKRIRTAMRVLFTGKP